MKRKLITLSGVLLCVLFLGINSSIPSVKISVAWYPWASEDAEGGEYCIWDDDLSSAQMNGELYSWSEIAEFANVNPAGMTSYNYEWEHIRAFVEENIFVFTKPGLTQSDLPKTWDINFDVDKKRELERPNGLVIRRLLTMKSQENDNQKILSAIMGVVKSAETKQRWEVGKAEFLEFNDYCANDNDSDEGRDYQTVKKATYNTAIVRAIDYYTRIIDEVNHSDKVYYSRFGNWILARIAGEYCQFMHDRSAFKFYSLCYRIGPEGCQKLKNYLSNARKDFTG